MIELWIIRLLLLSLIINLLFLTIMIKIKLDYQKNLNSITYDLKNVLDHDTDEKIMFFTDDKALIALNTQINRMLNERQNIKAEYRASQLSAKRMLSNISHDIRTPMTVIQGYVEMLLMDDSSIRDTLIKVDSKIKQVTKMIEDFFTLAKLESGDDRITLTCIHCNEVCKSSILGFYDTLTQKEFTIDIEIPEYDIFAFADKSAVERILNNIISNAIRYGYQGKYIQLSLYENDTHVFVGVLDKGRGIDYISEKHVFDRLYTVDDSRSKLIQGNGLGLTIAKELSLKMNGDLTLTSEPNVKTVFTLKMQKFKL
jgi:signal transduction histidine kinase